MNDDKKLRWSDVWLLQAVYYASQREQSLLPDVIAAADYINHAVINYEELSSGLVRLTHNNLILVDINLWKISCTEKAESMIAPLAKQIRSAYDLRKEIERTIGAIPWMPRDPLPHPANDLQYPSFSKEVYNTAVSAYLKNIKKRK